MENYHQTKEEMFNQEEIRMNNQLDAAAEKRANKALPHKFKTDLSLIDLAEVVGYTTALADILEYVNRQGNTAYGIINLNDLKGVIKETVLELKELKRAEIKTELNSLTQKTNP